MYLFLESMYNMLLYQSKNIVFSTSYVSETIPITDDCPWWMYNFCLYRNVYTHALFLTHSSYIY